METIAAVITGKTNAAISAIAISGDDAAAVCRDITGGGFSDTAAGSYRLCHIIADGRQIDEVLIGRESDDCCVINCHGNPLIIEAITAEISARGVKVVNCGDFAMRRLGRKHKGSTITAEAKWRQCGASGVDAVRLLQRQITGGLSGFVDKYLNAGVINARDVHNDCRRILADSDIAARMLRRIKVVLAGLPNSGKSTLFNRLCGKDAAIVTDKRGTTRDWINAFSQIGPLGVELIDTAGLDRSLCGGDIDAKSQEKTAELIKAADIILLVIDINDDGDTSGIAKMIADSETAAPVVKVYNKADTRPAFEAGDGVVISAANETNIDELIRRIIGASQVESLAPDAAVCFTVRQRRLVEQLLETDRAETIRDILERIKC